MKQQKLIEQKETLDREDATMEIYVQKNLPWLEELAWLLQDEDSLTRTEAAQELIEIGPAGALPMILQAVYTALNDEEDSFVIPALIRVVGALGEAAVAHRGLLQLAVSRVRLFHRWLAARMAAAQVFAEMDIAGAGPEDRAAVLSLLGELKGDRELSPELQALVNAALSQLGDEGVRILDLLTSIIRGSRKLLGMGATTGRERPNGQPLDVAPQAIEGALELSYQRFQEGDVCYALLTGNRKRWKEEQAFLLALSDGTEKLAFLPSTRSGAIAEGFVRLSAPTVTILGAEPLYASDALGASTAARITEVLQDGTDWFLPSVWALQDWLRAAPATLAPYLERELFRLHAPKRTWARVLPLPEEEDDVELEGEEDTEVCKLVPREEDPLTFTLHFRTTNATVHHQIVHVLALDSGLEASEVAELGKALGRVSIQGFTEEGTFVYGFDTALRLTDAPTEEARVGISVPAAMPISMASLRRGGGNTFAVAQNRAAVLATRGEDDGQDVVLTTVEAEEVQVKLCWAENAGELYVVATATSDKPLGKTVVVTVALADLEKNDLTRPERMWETACRFERQGEAGEQRFSVPLVWSEDVEGVLSLRVTD